jgi:CRISPR-associated protein Cmr6
MRPFILTLAGKLDSDTKKKPYDRRGQYENSGGGQHAGLLLQRYLCENATGEGGNPEEKRAVLQAAINAAGTTDVQTLFSNAFERWQKLLSELTAANVLQTVSRIIVGLGTENVLETGIRLHHTYGMPIIPGSALKGLAAHYCDQIWGERDKPNPSDEALKFRGPRLEDHKNNCVAESQGSYHKVLFGATDDTGCIVFHDAWFVPGEKSMPLKLDVMTPHHPNWLDGSEPPTDFDSPIPIPFLSVSGNFHVAVSWNGPKNYEESVKWTKLAFELLLAGVTNWGIGGKTTSDYGRMIELDPTKRKNPYSASALGLPEVGKELSARLLKQPKQGKPWRAQVQLKNEKVLSGQIEGILPDNLEADNMVNLIVTDIGENRICFKWPDKPKRQD